MHTRAIRPSDLVIAIARPKCPQSSAPETRRLPLGFATGFFGCILPQVNQIPHFI